MAKDKGVKEETKVPKKKRKSKVKLIIELIFIIIVLLGCLFAVIMYNKYGKTVIELYQDSVIKVDSSDRNTFKASQTSLIYDTDGNELASIKGEKDVYYIEYNSIPQYVKDAFISVEDKKFYSHTGVDLKATLRAFLALIQNNGEITQGGSTITQQLARNVFLSNEVSWKRKVEEIFIAWQLENIYTKEDILEFYINNIYFANGYYGIQAASNGYFNKSVNFLTLSQIAFLCAIPNSPTAYEPYENKDRTLLRRDKILKEMRDDGKITEQEYIEAINEEIKVKKKKVNKNNSIETFVFSCATKSLMKANGFEFRNSFENDEDKEEYNEQYTEMYDICYSSLYTSGYRIYTSIDMNIQEELQKSIDETLVDFTSVNSEGVYELQSSGVCIDNSTGRVVAIVGGRSQDLTGYTLNRAYQSFRQPGSTIKPLIVYTPILERGYTPDTIVDDSPMPDRKPANAGGVYEYDITLRRAVEKSRNVVAWRLFEELTPKVGLEYLKEMNFAKIVPDDYYLASSLGGFTYGTSALEMASGYATIENGGIYRNPTCIVMITDATGSVIVSDDIEEKRIYEKQASLMMTDILKGVIEQGTASGLGVPNMDTAAKTGTTNGSKDGWLCGFTPYYTTSIWVGYDVPKELSNLYGATYPGKIWNTFMVSIHDGLESKEFKKYDGYEEESTTEEYTEPEYNYVEPEPIVTEEVTEEEEEITEEEVTEEVTTEEITTEAIQEIEDDLDKIDDIIEDEPDVPNIDDDVDDEPYIPDDDYDDDFDDNEIDWNENEDDYSDDMDDSDFEFDDIMTPIDDGPDDNIDVDDNVDDEPYIPDDNVDDLNIDDEIIE